MSLRTGRGSGRTAQERSPGTGSGGGGGGLAGGTSIQDLFRQDFEAIFGAGLLSEDVYNPLLDSQMYTATRYARSDNFTGGVLLGSTTIGQSGLLWNANADPGINVADPHWIANPRNQPWAVGAMCSFAANPGATTNTYVALLGSADDSVGLLIHGSVSTTILRMEVDGSVSGSGTTNQLCNNGVAGAGTLGSGIVVGANNFYRFLIGFDPNTGICSAAVNGVLAGHCTPGTTMPNKALSPYMATNCPAAQQQNYHAIQALWLGYGL